METAGASAPSWRRILGAALVAAAAALPLPGPATAAEATDSITLLAPGRGCGPAEATTGTTALLDRVRASRRPALPRTKPGVGPRQAERPSLPEEAPAAFQHAFFTCAGTPPAIYRVGAGWLAVGPVRRS